MHSKCLILVALSATISAELPCSFCPSGISFQCRGSWSPCKNQGLIIHALGAFSQGLIHSINDWSRCTVLPFWVPSFNTHSDEFIPVPEAELTRSAVLCSLQKSDCSVSHYNVKSMDKWQVNPHHYMYDLKIKAIPSKTKQADRSKHILIVIKILKFQQMGSQ